MAHTPDFDRYLVACDYPGLIDPPQVAMCLRHYVRALGIPHHVRQLPINWSLATEDSLWRTVLDVLLDFAKQTGHDILVARTASDTYAARSAYAALTTNNAREAHDARNALIARNTLTPARATHEAIDVRETLVARKALDTRASLMAHTIHNAVGTHNAVAMRDALATHGAGTPRDTVAMRDALATHNAHDAIAARGTMAALAVYGTTAAHDALAARDTRAMRNSMAACDVLAAFHALGALEARAVLDVLDTLSLHRFASWCLHRDWSWWHWDLSRMSTTWLGTQLGRDLPWARSLFEAFIAGAWFLFWTDDTLYWIAKPVLHVEPFNGGRRLHCADGPALESDVENLYFWHGVLVPAFVVTRPDWITLDHIQHEENAEVRRVMLDRYGLDRYVQDTGALPISADNFGTLYRIEQADEPLVVIRLQNATRESDGSFKQYMLRVDPMLRPLPSGEWSAARKLEWFECQQSQDLTARNAVASLHGLRGDKYGPVVET